MSDDDKHNSEHSSLPRSLGSDWGSGQGTGRTKLFESGREFDIVCDKEKGVNYIFHGKELECTIDHLEYDPETSRITVCTTDGQKLDLGEKIQWLVRPYIAKEQDLLIIRTENGEAVDGVQAHLYIKKPPSPDDDDRQTRNTGNFFN